MPRLHYTLLSTIFPRIKNEDDKIIGVVIYSRSERKRIEFLQIIHEELL